MGVAPYYLKERMKMEKKLKEAADRQRAKEEALERIRQGRGIVNRMMSGGEQMPEYSAEGGLEGSPMRSSSVN